MLRAFCSLAAFRFRCFRSFLPRLAVAPSCPGGSGLAARLSPQWAFPRGSLRRRAGGSAFGGLCFRVGSSGTVRPNNAFKPNLLRSTKAMAEKACHGFGSTTQVGLTQALCGSALLVSQLLPSDTPWQRVGSAPGCSSLFVPLLVGVLLRQRRVVRRAPLVGRFGCIARRGFSPKP